ncbi:MAG: T9SS type A sorting domain-containing protein, partial [Bacteroidia bacterium]|nr:T9SS type A sorting domain-containing protein [Bacteroidia bacterium]
GNLGDGSPASTFYFDDVQQVSTLGIEDQDFSTLKIYPNPVGNKLFIESNTIELTKIEIFSLVGNKVMEFNSNLNSITVDDLSSGFYLIKIYNYQGSTVKKLLKR